MAIPILRDCGLDPTAATDLADACRARGLDPASVLDRIGAAEDAVADGWPARTIHALIDHIRLTYHRSFDHDVRAAEAAIDDASRAEAPAAGSPWRALRDHLEELRTLVTEHMIKEEQVLFPWISTRGHTAGGPIRAMQLDHIDTIGLLLAVRAACAACTGPWLAAIAAPIDALERQLCEHIFLEDGVLFRRALES